MATPKVGNKAPVFKGICTGKGTADLSKLKGKKVVLYFYPKDSTPGCTTCLLYTSPSPRDLSTSRMPSSA